VVAASATPHRGEIQALLLFSRLGTADRRKRPTRWQAIAICEPSPGGVPDAGLPARRSAGRLFTATIEPPPREEVRGIFVDLLWS
jgi:hypothetical protein